MIQFPHAKINLGLSVLARRPDGFHDIETIFYPVPLCDVVEMLPATATSLTLSGLPVPGSSGDNLLIRAWNAVKAERPSLSPMQILLYKAIPMGAGLGGGSSDAATLLRMINRFFHLTLSETELAVIAGKLGSDCAFFLQDEPCIGTGRGELLEPVALDLSGYDLLLVHPERAVPTAWAYSRIIPSAPAIPMKTVAALPPEQWKETMFNAFETPVFAVHPELAAIKKELYEAGAIYAAMTGSGSTLFGLFSPGTSPVHSIGAGYSRHLLAASRAGGVW